MAPVVREWLDVLEELYPSAWAEPWDATGLQAGDRSWPAERVLVALDPTLEIIEEARERGCALVVAHHPLVFRPLSRLDMADPAAMIAVEAVRAEVAVAACHTNADVAAPGVTDALAEVLGIEVTGVLRATEAGARMKLVTFVPRDATSKVLDAVAGAGAGVIGEYSHCSFRVGGWGTFLPSERADPVVGRRGELNEVEEDRLEVVVPRERLAPVVDALLDAHPYEEVAYDVYSLDGPSGLGLGRLGRMPETLTASELVERCRDRLGGTPRAAGPLDREIATVALCGGSGGDLLSDAVRSGADAYVTGDLKHHQALEAASAGLAIIDAGHFPTEWPFVPHLAQRLGEGGPGDVEVSERRTDPFEVPR